MLKNKLAKKRPMASVIAFVSLLALLTPFLAGCLQKPAERRVSLIAAGDNLLHEPLLRAALTADGYHFTPFYAPVESLVRAADMAFVNQEGAISDTPPPSGFPLFNAPTAAGEALFAAGFNIINMANNHALDMGAEAVAEAADFWAQKGALAPGVNASRQAAEQIPIIEVEGIKFAFLAYTAGGGANAGLLLSQPHLMNIIDYARLKSDIKRARQLARAVIVSLHWGAEYAAEPLPEQRLLAQFLADCGVILIIGHHPHVLQKPEFLTGREGNRALAVYSLGNFISAQENPETVLGGLLAVNFVYDGNTARVEEGGVLPLITHYDSHFRRFATYPLYAYSDNLAARHALAGKGRFDAEYLQELANSSLGEFMLGAEDYWRVVGGE